MSVEPHRVRDRRHLLYLRLSCELKAGSFKGELGSGFCSFWLGRRQGKSGYKHADLEVQATYKWVITLFTSQF